MGSPDSTGQCQSSCGTEGGGHSDWAGTSLSMLKVWGLPLAAFVAGFLVADLPRTILWTAALCIAGGACVLNAYRCKRLHCYFSGPYFLLAAVVVLLAHAGVMPVPVSVWLGLGIAVGGVAVYYLPEYVWGRYRQGTGIVLASTITCPNCGKQSSHTMPTDSCQFFMACPHCDELLRPKAGDCCVFCSYGTVKCPSKQ